MARVTPALLLLFALSAGAPAPQQPTARLGGVLTAADNGQPVRKATITLVSTSPRMTRTTSSDGEGRWSFDDLPGGEYALRAARPGYLEVVYGARQPGRSRQGTSIVLSAGQQLDDLVFSLPRAGVIAGVVTDEYGDPAFNVPVRALRYVFQNGERIVQVAGNATTDDLGAYRIAGLMPGDYLVTSIPRDTVAAAFRSAQGIQQRQRQMEAAARAGNENARAAIATMQQAQREGRMPEPVSPIGYVPMYYPGTSMPAAAAPVTVGLSSQIFGIDIRLQIVETARIEGTVLSDEGGPIQGNVRLIDPAMPVTTIGAWFTSSSPDGRFSFAGLVPGVYAIGGNNAPPGMAGGPPESGGPPQTSPMQPVTVSGSDVSDVEVRMRPGAAISGRLDLESITDPIDLETVRVNFFPVSTAADWEMALVRQVPESDGTFAFTDVTPARYRVDVAGLPNGWHLESAVFDGVDAADHHLTVEPAGTYEGGVLAFTNQAATLTGVVTDLQQQPIARHSVVLFPSDPTLRLPQSRRIRVAQSGPDGRYAIRALPPGQYRLAVVADIETDQQFNREFLEDLVPASLEIELTAGQSAVQDIRVR